MLWSFLDVYLNNPGQKDYEIFVDTNEEDENDLNDMYASYSETVNEGTYDLYWLQ